MRVVIQRVSEASVSINNALVGSVTRGLLVLVGIEEADDSSDLEWMARKICHMRIFNDEQGKMNRSVLDIEGEILVISQFTLHARTKKGNRPSFMKAAPPKQAIPLYDQFCNLIENLLDRPIATGKFGADMQIKLINDGPVTIVMDSKNKD